MAELKRDFETRAYVSEVFYDIPLLEILDNNIKKITQGIIALVEMLDQQTARKIKNNEFARNIIPIFIIIGWCI